MLFGLLNESFSTQSKNTLNCSLQHSVISVLAQFSCSTGGTTQMA